LRERISAKEMAEIVGVSPSLIYKLASQGIFRTGCMRVRGAFRWAEGNWPMNGAAFLLMFDKYSRRRYSRAILSSWTICQLRRSGVRDSIEATGATLRYLPPYSPDLNPIENAFAKLKALLRKVAARTIDNLWLTIRDALPEFTSTECANYIIAAGYKPG
jgi:transposase